jgi:hypothetical protein
MNIHQIKIVQANALQYGIFHVTLWSENLKEKDQQEDLGVDGDINTYIKQKGCEVVDWIYLAQNVDLGASSSEHYNETSRAIECWIFFKWLGK